LCWKLWEYFYGNMELLGITWTSEIPPTLKQLGYTFLLYPEAGGEGCENYGGAAITVLWV
jgi:hypothetical protein